MVFSEVLNLFLSPHSLSRIQPFPFFQGNVSLINQYIAASNLLLNKNLALIISCWNEEKLWPYFVVLKCLLATQAVRKRHWIQPQLPLQAVFCIILCESLEEWGMIKRLRRVCACLYTKHWSAPTEYRIVSYVPDERTNSEGVMAT